jgi:predicted RNA binding protein YcfA (HicA-like mRNA interferase family)
MSKREKLIKRIRARPPEADFDDVRALLEDFGWALARTSGSHNTFTKDGVSPIVVPTVSGRRVKQHYLDRLCDLLGLDD